MKAMRVVVAAMVMAGTVAALGQATQPDAVGEQKAGALGAGGVVAFELQNPRSIAADGAGNLFVVDVGTNKIVKITKKGEATVMDGPGMADIQSPIAVWASKDGELAVADLDNNKVYRVSPKGEAGEVATGGKTSAPAGAVVDSKGNVFVADNKDGTVIRITPAGEASVFAGKSGDQGNTDGKGDAARFSMPRAITIDAQDNLYVADEGNSNIRKITPEGEVTTLAGGTGGGGAGDADGKGAAAHFAAPRGIAVDKDGNVYVADTDDHAVRKVTPEGVVTTIAGKVGESGNQDGAKGESRLDSPRGVAVDDAGNVFVADSENGVIREISPDGTVRTIVGTK